MGLESLTEEIRRRAATEAGLGARVKIAFGDGGAILIDATRTPPEVSNEDGEAACTIRISLADFEKVLAGELDPNLAFMTGRLKVEGDMGLALRLAAFLGD